MYEITLLYLLLVALLNYMEVIMDILSHNRYTLKLKRTRFISKSREYVGINVKNGGKIPEESNCQYLRRWLH